VKAGVHTAAKVGFVGGEKWEGIVGRDYKR